MSELRNLFFSGSPSCITSSVGVELPVLLASLSIKTNEILYQELANTLSQVQINKKFWSKIVIFSSNGHHLHLTEHMGFITP